MCGLLTIPDFQPADLGFAFLPEYCGQGFAEEASTLALDNGHKSHHLDEVLAITLTANILSNHLLMKLGFTFTELVEYLGTTDNLYSTKLVAQIDK
jgi:RimJ/RimL family protein N-acetyltransferase